MRDFIYIADVAEAFADACERLVTEKMSGFHLVNLCSGEGMAIADLAKCIREMADPAVAIEYMQRRPGDASRLVGSTDRFQQYFSRLAAVTGFAEGLARTLEWQRRRVSCSPRPAPVAQP